MPAPALQQVRVQPGASSSSHGHWRAEGSRCCTELGKPPQPLPVLPPWPPDQPHSSWGCSEQVGAEQLMATWGLCWILAESIPVAGHLM